MKANELRIGNLLGYLEVDLESGSEVIKNHPCTLNDIAEIERGNVCNRYSEVLITEYWLKRFGFETSPKSDYWTLYLSDMDKDEFARQRIDVWFMESRTVAELCRAGVCFKMVTCNFVHQLQNLYFCLLGAELQLSST